MRISYAITVANETREFIRLIDFLRSHMDMNQDEIVVLADSSKVTPEIDTLLHSYQCREEWTIQRKEFAGNFADWKNYLNSMCRGEWIFQLDADELPSEDLIKNLHQILETTEAEAIAVPRKNIVERITQEDIRRWGWRETPYGLNWPDYQWRLYKNIPDRIKWVGKVHERPNGFLKFAVLPDNQTIYRLDHFKNIEKQRKQNDYYDTLLRG